MSTSYRLEELTWEYRKFKDDQVLSANQLNEILRFFEDQHRLTRTVFLGVGLASGLEPAWDGVQLTLSAGAGLTTDGDIVLEREPLTFTYYKGFVDEDAKYGSFIREDGGQIDLWELFDAEEAAAIEEVKGIGVFQAEEDHSMSDLVVLAYLENYDQAPDVCTDISCDTDGIRRVSRVRWLLARKEDVDQVVNPSDSIYRPFGDAREAFHELPQIALRRLIVQANNSLSNAALSSAYLALVTRPTSESLTLPPAEQLKQAVTYLFDHFAFLLDPGEQVSFTNWETAYDQSIPAATSGEKAYFQYFYAYFRDLVQAYHELRHALFDLRRCALPDTSAFPKHLLLGILAPDPEDRFYRHQFYPSPISESQEELLGYVRSLFLRLTEMVFVFNPKNLYRNETRITPGIRRSRRLADRAIPFYYDLTDRLVEHWDYEGSRRKNPYRLAAYRPLSSTPALTEPLDYLHEDSDFYRIEGCQGRDYRSVKDEILELRDRKSLPFEVVFLRMGKTADDIVLSEYSAFFEDLEAVFEDWKAQQDCLLAAATRFFSGFSFKEKGKHADYDCEEAAASSPTSGGGGASGAAFMQSMTWGGIPTANSFINLNTREPVEEAAATETAKWQIETVQENKVVDKNVVSVEGALGSMAAAAFASVSWQSPKLAWERDIWNLIPREEINTWAEEDKNICLAWPTRLLAALKAVTKLMPANVYELERSRINQLGLEIHDLSKDAEQIKRLFLGILRMEGYPAPCYADQYRYFLNLLTANTCAADQVHAIMDEIEIRKEQILGRTNFSNFAREHPGMEHLGGVPVGGTFVVVYKDEEVRPPLLQPVVSPASVQAASTSLVGLESAAGKVYAGKGSSIIRQIKLNAYQGIDTFGQFVIDNYRELDIEKEVSDFYTFHRYNPILPQADHVVNWIRDGIRTRELQGRTSVISRFTVVADFCLPYQRTSSLPPLAFILPRQYVSLRLPAAFLCWDEDQTDSQRIYFEVKPKDGVVEPEFGFKQLVGKDNAGYYLDLSKVTENILGKIIEFTVNNQTTNCTAVIYRKPKPAFSMEIGEKRNKSPNDYIDIRFSNLTPQGDNDFFSWNWDFGDDAEPDYRTDRNPVHRYYLQRLRDLNRPTVTVRLTVRNGQCMAFFEEQIEFDLTVKVANVEFVRAITVEDANSLPAIATAGQLDPADPVLGHTGWLLNAVIGDDWKLPDFDLLDEYIFGEHNTDLPAMFQERIGQTADNIIEMKDNPARVTAYGNMLQIQIRLFLDLLLCQEDLEVVADDELDQVLKLIIERLDTIRNAGINIF